MKKTAIVTAFFDIGRGAWGGDINGGDTNWLNRPTIVYMVNFAKLARLNNDMIIHTTADLAETILAIRDEAGVTAETKIIVHPPLQETYANLVNAISAIMSDPSFITKVREPNMPEYWNPLYVLVNFLKAHFVNQSLHPGIGISADQYAWIDFGYCRDNGRFSENFNWAYDFGDKINLFNIKPLDDRPISEIVHDGDVYIQGCHIVAPPAGWQALETMVTEALTTLLNSRVIDDDQTLLLMAQRSNPDAFTVRFNDVTQDGWFTIFKDYQ